MPSDLAELADQIEQAEGPSRELDAEIVTALYPDALINIYCEGDEEPLVWHAEPLVRNKRELPRYTASLDAATTLVPEGFDWAVFRTNGGLTVHAWCGSREDVFGATAALALCAAALRARQALAGTTPEQVCEQ